MTNKVKPAKSFSFFILRADSSTMYESTESFKTSALAKSAARLEVNEYEDIGIIFGLDSDGVMVFPQDETGYFTGKDFLTT